MVGIAQVPDFLFVLQQADAGFQGGDAGQRISGVGHGVGL
jgi:hypothetical protein